MLDNVDNDLKLLKMVEKLLEVTDENHEVNLEKYAKLAKEIDSVNYNNIIDKLKDKSNIHNQSLEEELIFLEEIENEYEQLNQLQFKFKNTYERYALSNLELSNINDINIDAILERKNLISGYLVNLKNIDDNKKKLEKFNESLIIEDRKRISVEQRLGSLEEELKNSFINSEGRVYSKNSGIIQSTSVIAEYKENDIDLLGLVNDKELLDKMLNEAYELRKDKEEVLSTAELCYEHAPTKDSMEILSSIRMDAIRARYRLSLFKMVKLISNVEESYGKVISKREELLDLIKYRSDCLREIGVKFSIDPFERIKVSEQLKFLSEINDNSKTISSIRREISSISDNLEELEKRNTEFILDLNKKEKFVIDNLSMSSIDISNVGDYVVNPFESLINESVKDILPNQVVRVKEIPSKFMLTRGLEKTKSVINRVYEMINGSFDTEIHEEIVPELVVESKEELSINEDKDALDIVIPLESDVNYKEEYIPETPKLQTLDETLDELVSSKDDDLFQNVEPFKDVEFFNNRLDMFEEKDSLSFDELSDIDKKDDSFELILNDDFGNLVSDNLDSASNEEKIFDDIDLSEEKDSESVSDENVFEDELPDAFWVTQENDNNNVDNVLSFDEQINKLLSNENNEPKIRKLAA